MAVLSGIQSGSFNLTGTTQNQAISSITLANSILLFTYRNSGTNPGTGSIAARLTSSTNIQFARDSSGTTGVVQWYVLTFSSGVTVQRGTQSFTSGGTNPINVTISSVDTSKAWPIISTYTAGSTWGRDDCATAAITSSTNLQLQMGTVNNFQLFWQVVEYDNCSVQRDSKLLGSTSTSGNTTITSVNLSKSLVFISQRNINAQNAINFNSVYRARLSSSTNINYQRDSANNVAMRVEAYVVEFTDDVTVQRGQQTLTGAITNISISALSDTNRAVPIHGGYCGVLTTTNNASDNWAIGAPRLEITSTTNLQATRVSTTGSQSTFLNWEVIVWESGVVEDVFIDKAVYRGVCRGVGSGVY